MCLQIWAGASLPGLPLPASDHHSQGTLRPRGHSRHAAWQAAWLPRNRVTAKTCVWKRSSTKQPLGPGVLCAEDRGGRECTVALHLDRTALSPPKLICHFPLSTGGGRGSGNCASRHQRPGCEGRPAPRPLCLSRGRRLSEQHGRPWRAVRCFQRRSFISSR